MPSTLVFTIKFVMFTMLLLFANILTLSLGVAQVLCCILSMNFLKRVCVRDIDDEEVVCHVQRGVPRVYDEWSECQP